MSRERIAPWWEVACAAAFVVLGAVRATAQKVPLVLHHLIISVDTTTWNDILHSPFLRDQFAASESGYLSPPDAGTGIRLMGKYNYLQLMPSGVPAWVGIVLAVEQGGALAALKRQGPFVEGRLSSLRDHSTSEGVHVVESSDRVRPAGIDSTSTRVGFEFLEYTADAAHRRSAADSLPAENRSSARFLAGYFDAQKLLSHLTAATLAISVEDIAKIIRVVERDGIAVTPQGEGATIQFDGFTLKLVPSYEGAGVKQLQFALTRTAVGNPVYRFGPKSQLRFGPGPIAVWDFKWP